MRIVTCVSKVESKSQDEVTSINEINMVKALSLLSRNVLGLPDFLVNSWMFKLFGSLILKNPLKMY